MLRKLCKDQEGGIVLEAALILPLFLSFVVGLILFIQIAIAEMALQAGVSEATKSIAGQVYPVQLLVQEAKSKYDQSAAANLINTVVDQVQSARSQIVNTENFVEQYAAYIPDYVLALVQWEQEKRELGEGMAEDELNAMFESQVKPRILAAFTPIVFAFCDANILHRENFKVTAVTVPSMVQNEDSYFGVEAQLTYKLPIPFISHTIVLKKRAFERAWVGSSSM
ncbi:pilus assembly protein [Paenibacillus qinlingensis]|uniref:TadE family protein n=1 Tax=Paenibacillus qinlingensis TaxID=1837343 RepID=A0ABU1NRN8_9BACL|nr:pilus assembly protein [Paenibacillus qinlingensis]MDR6549696.1 hypothetical protein [Paenibacillus qinlingensis]